MKLSELVVGKEYAVVPSWQYSSRGSRDVNSVRENDVVKSTLVSLDKYEYQASQRSQDPNSFTKAQAGNRSVGVLVKATDQSGSEIFWTSRLADIVALWSDLEPRWAQAKSAEAEAERIQNEKRNKAIAHRQLVDNEINRARNSVIATSKELLGDTTFVNVDTTGYDLEYRGVVTLSLAEFEKLIELAYQGKEVYA